MRFINILALSCAAFMVATPAQARIVCAQHDTMMKILGDQFAEQKSGMGLATKDAMVELYVSKSGTFTLVSTDTQGLSCIFGAGNGWEKAEPQKQADSSM